MPPPSLIPVAHGTLTPSSSRDMPPPVPPEKHPPHAFSEARPDSTNPPGRFNPIRHTSFKPITQTSSSLKKFFPGDEDDMDLTSDGPQFAAPRETGVFPRFSPPLPERKRIQTPPPRRDGLEGEGGRLPSPMEPNPFYRHGQTLAINEMQHHKLSVKGPVPDRDNHELVSTPSLGVRGELYGIVSQVGGRLPSPMEPNSFYRYGQTLAINEIQHPKSSVKEPVPDRDNHELASLGVRGELYSIVSQVGEGTFGKVYKAQNTVTKVHVALKRIRMEAEKDGFPVTAMREIKLLQSLQHQNVVRLYEMMISNGIPFLSIEKTSLRYLQVQSTWSSSTWTMI